MYYICSISVISWTPWVPKYQVDDAQGNHVFTIEGECCYCCICQDIFFKVSMHLN